MLYLVGYRLVCTLAARVLYVAVITALTSDEGPLKASHAPQNRYRTTGQGLIGRLKTPTGDRLALAGEDCLSRRRPARFVSIRSIPR